MFRISTAMMFDRSVDTMMRQSADLLKTSQQISSGRRVLTPSDDPAAAARALATTQSLAINTQYARNQGYAEDALNLFEGTLASVTEHILYVRERTVQAGHGGLSPTDQGVIAGDLRAQFGALMGLANTRNASGDAVFAGYKSHVQPFQGSLENGVEYVGDAEARTMRVSWSRDMAVSVQGDQVFGRLLDTFRDLVLTLEDPSAPDEHRARVVADALVGFDQALDDVLNVRARVGAQQVELEQLSLINGDMDFQLRTILSDYQDVDYAAAISHFVQQQTMLQAAQQSFMRISGLSLFNYL
ncbi:MAG: flagellar hook-associated protein 3 [Sphingobacteriia bacterium]|nr:flagellar hook-associated protein 3 [Sphingobacteriia bacterium]NCC39001.1 flagellar hook-associated protein 3 [Gammaproteobacteria bacterium]